MFNANLYNVFLRLIPLALRKPKLIAWLKVFVSQVKLLKDFFVDFREQKLFFLAHNSQVIYLEHILNHYFNPEGTSNDPDYEGNGIYITDGQYQDNTYLFHTNEQSNETYLYHTSEQGEETYIYHNTEQGVMTGFIVWVPTDFSIDENEVKSIINRFKLAGKLYNIKYYTKNIQQNESV